MNKDNEIISNAMPEEASEPLPKAEIEYFFKFEGTLGALESELHKDDDPRIIAMRAMHVAMDFYDAEWCGIIVGDMDAEIFYPEWWTNREKGDMADTNFEDIEYLKNYKHWVGALRESRTITIPDTRAESEWVDETERERYLRMGVHSVMGAPLFYHEPCGFLVIKNPKRYIDYPNMMAILGYVVLNCWKENQIIEQKKMQMKQPCTKLLNERDLFIRLFGVPELHSLKGQISADSYNAPKVWRVIVYMVLHGKNPVSLKTISEELDPGYDPDCGVKALRTTMSRMKSALETVLVPTEPLLKPAGNGCYLLNPYYHITTYLDIFNQTVEQAKNHRIPSKRLRALMTAATTYRDTLFKEASGDHWLIGDVVKYELQYNEMIGLLFEELAKTKDIQTLHKYAKETVDKVEGNAEAYFQIIHIILTNCSKDLARSELDLAKKRLTKDEWKKLCQKLQDRFGDDLIL